MSLIGVVTAGLGIAPTSAKPIGLILAIADYPAQPLPGVHRDVGHAIKIAEAFGVRPPDLTIKRDQDLTRGGLLLALDEFVSRVETNDRVFVYYSGHGTSININGSCRQAIVGIDAGKVLREEFVSRLRPAFERASKSFLFLDSCFSGGVVEEFSSRGVRSTHDEAVSTSKFWSVRGADSCALASNVARTQRDFDPEPSHPNQFLLAAASDTEEAIDGGKSVGGFATASVVACLGAHATVDADGDGVTLWSEVARCAQAKLDDRIASHRASKDFPFLRQTLVPVVGRGGDTPAGSLVQNPTGAEETLASGDLLLQTIRRMADSRKSVTLRSRQSSYRVGRDVLSLSVESSTDGYVTLLSVGSSGMIVQLFPNKFDSSNRIDAGRPLSLPRDSWQLRSRGPAGTTRILAIVSDRPLDFSDLAQPSGVFQSIKSTKRTATDIAERITGLAQRCRSDAQVGRRQRDFDVEASGCAYSYGADSLQLVEE